MLAYRVTPANIGSLKRHKGQKRRRHTDDRRTKQRDIKISIRVQSTRKVVVAPRARNRETETLALLRRVSLLLRAESVVSVALCEHSRTKPKRKTYRSHDRRERERETKFSCWQEISDLELQPHERDSPRGRYARRYPRLARRSDR